MAGGITGARLIAMLLIAGLAACQGAGGASSSRSGGSPAGVPIVLESIDGAPAPVRTALVNELTTAAADRKVEIVGSGTDARYRVRGYLSTETTEGETSVAYVWDVFDAQKKRAQRLAGSSPVRVASWNDLDRETLARLAVSSMDEIAEFLAASKAETPIQTANVAGVEPAVTAQ
ncbi:MAG: hypothetical protein ABWY78_18695 [Microvirga sp.]